MVVDAKDVQKDFDKYIKMVEQDIVIKVCENRKIVAELQPITNKIS